MAGGSTTTASAAQRTSKTGATVSESQSQSTNGRGLHLLTSLPALQNVIKRSPDSYRDEFLAQWAMQESLREMLSSTVLAGVGSAVTVNKKEEDKWQELVNFVGNVAHLYRETTAGWEGKLARMLLDDSGIGDGLSVDTQRTIVGTLVGMRRRGVIDPIDLLKTLFPLLSKTTSQSLRSHILKTILSDLKTSNTPTKNHKLNRLVQGLLFGMVERGIGEGNRYELEGTGIKNKGRRNNNSNNNNNNNRLGGKGKNTESQQTPGIQREAMWAIKLATELWRKGVWRDEKTVGIVRLACFHPNTKVQSAAVHFFLNHGQDDQDLEEDTEDEGDKTTTEKDLRQVQHKQGINKKTKSRKKEVSKTKKDLSKKRKRHDEQQASANFSALQLLQDPQSFTERIYDPLLMRYDKSYLLDHKVLLIRLFSRVTSYHQLIHLPFYTYMLKYISPHQLLVTSLLASLAESVHELTPPDAIWPVVKKIANEFVHPGVASEVVCVGLNSIREICRRQPLVMTEGAAMIATTTTTTTTTTGEEEKEEEEGGGLTGSSGIEEGRALAEDLSGYKKSGDKSVMVAARGLLQLWRETVPDLLRKRDRGKRAAMALKEKESSGGSANLKGSTYGRAQGQGGQIEGLDLLASHLSERQHEVEEEEEWKNWDLDESDPDEDSDNDGWINVDSDDDDDIEISGSDSDDDGKRKRQSKKRKLDDIAEDDEAGDETGGDGITGASSEANRLEAEAKALELASTRILTPADWAKITELRTQALEAEIEASSGSSSAAKKRLATLKASKQRGGTGNEDSSRFLDQGDIEGARKRAKNTKEERMESIQKGREGREKFGSGKGKHKNESKASTTNREKQRGKAFAMVAQSRQVKRKGKASLVDKQKRLRGHIDNTKRRKATGKRK